MPASDDDDDLLILVTADSIYNLPVRASPSPLSDVTKLSTTKNEEPSLDSLSSSLAVTEEQFRWPYQIPRRIATSAINIIFRETTIQFKPGNNHDSSASQPQTVRKSESRRVSKSLQPLDHVSDRVVENLSNPVNSASQPPKIQPPSSAALLPRERASKNAFEDRRLSQTGTIKAKSCSAFDGQSLGAEDYSQKPSWALQQAAAKILSLSPLPQRFSQSNFSQELATSSTLQQNQYFTATSALQNASSAISFKISPLALQSASSGTTSSSVLGQTASEEKSGVSTNKAVEISVKPTLSQGRQLSPEDIEFAPKPIPNLSRDPLKPWGSEGDSDWLWEVESDFELDDDYTPISKRRLKKKKKKNDQSLKKPSSSQSKSGSKGRAQATLPTGLEAPSLPKSFESNAANGGDEGGSLEDGNSSCSPNSNWFGLSPESSPSRRSQSPTEKDGAHESLPEPNLSSNGVNGKDKGSVVTPQKSASSATPMEIRRIMMRLNIDLGRKIR
ncbi:hypothetical protein BC829DRAFT_444771 [Chytridium lagenaria]|nr:hypothetical protein BC829DRAFT_444771 [Chytridium lagenaria]